MQCMLCRLVHRSTVPVDTARSFRVRCCVRSTEPRPAGGDCAAGLNSTRLVAVDAL